MSRHANHVVTVSDNAEVLEVIREEQCSPTVSSVNIDNASKVISVASVEPQPCTDCACAKTAEIIVDKMDAVDVEKLLSEKEEILRQEFQQVLEEEVNQLKEKFDFILQNEQVRASYMLREAHRERQEKIRALQTQLECKNLAGLMYVMCSERRKRKLEKLRLIEEYTNYIRALQEILAEGQDLILHLSRGYKTAARVDHEWRAKMKKIITEFQCYVYHFAGGPPESNQYIFDLPALLKTHAPIVDNPLEDPIEKSDDGEDEEFVEGEQEETPWYEQMEGECRPFIMFGDMADFQPPQRREVLKHVKAAKTAPQKWKDYVFNEMFVRSGCSNMDAIKSEYPKRAPDARWVCQEVQADWDASRTSIAAPRERHTTATSIDVRGNMGSILKIITSNVTQVGTKANLLAARDSMEIVSTTKLKERHNSMKQSDASKVKINVGNRVASMMDQFDYERKEMGSEELEEFSMKKLEGKRGSVEEEEEEEEKSASIMGSVHNDSLQVLNSHKADKDHKINYEKVCPMDQCKRMQMDSFMRALPPYMRANPFTYYEQNYENYETCSPDQLEILKQRIEDKKKKDHGQEDADESPLDEWSLEVEGVGVQTSDTSLPPCTCIAPSPSLVSSNGMIFNMADLYPIKQTLNKIRQACFFDDNIEFDRFKVIGQESEETVHEVQREDFKKKRLGEIKKILKQHPSLLDIFQANAIC